MSPSKTDSSSLTISTMSGAISFGGRALILFPFLLNSIQLANAQEQSVHLSFTQVLDDEDVVFRRLMRPCSSPAQRRILRGRRIWAGVLLAITTFHDSSQFTQLPVADNDLRQLRPLLLWLGWWCTSSMGGAGGRLSTS